MQLPLTFCGEACRTTRTRLLVGLAVAVAGVCVVLVCGMLRDELVSGVGGGGGVGV